MLPDFAQDVPWQIMPNQVDKGMPVGSSPGKTNLVVLAKVLHRSSNGSTTTLLKFPPGV